MNLSFIKNNSKQFFLVLFFLTSVFGLNKNALGQKKDGEIKTNNPSVYVHWMTIEEAVERSKVQKKKILIAVYADWSGWSKAMDEKTFGNATVAKFINEKFYPVKFNSEQKKDVVFNNRTYHYVVRGRSVYHQFTALLLNNKLSYPAITILEINKNSSELHPIVGYRTAYDLYPLLVFFANDYYKQTTNSWKKFQEIYKSPF